MEKAPLIEFDKRGIATVITSEAMIMLVLAITALNPAGNALEVVIKILMVVGGTGISLTLFIVSATIQDGKIKKNLAEKETLCCKPAY